MLQTRQPPPDAIALECTHCQVVMTPAPQGESRVRYFCCPSCHGWATTMYSDAVLRHAGARLHRPAPRGGVDFEAVKQRMSAWTARLDREDPFQTLGVAPNTSADVVRERYRELAHRHHPDVGGDSAEMGRVNDAYQRIRRRHG
jgi:hypothetical protein